MKCKRCGEQFEPHNPSVYQDTCDDCDYIMALQDEAAREVLAGEMTPSTMAFMDFRTRILDTYQDVIDDNEIHALFMRHVMGREEATVEQPRPTERPNVFKVPVTAEERARVLREAARNSRVQRVRKLEPLRLEKPEFDMVGGKPLMETTLGELASAVGRKARTIVRIALGSRK